MTAFEVKQDQSILIYEPSRVILRDTGPVTLVVLQLDRQPRRRPQLDEGRYPTKPEILAARLRAAAVEANPQPQQEKTP